MNFYLTVLGDIQLSASKDKSYYGDRHTWARGGGDGGGDSPMQPVKKLPPMHRPFLDHPCRKNHQISQASPTHLKKLEITLRCHWKKLFLHSITSQTIQYFSPNMSTFSAQCSIEYYIYKSFLLFFLVDSRCAAKNSFPPPIPLP